METEISKAIKVLVSELKNDPSYRNTWIANIAMSFQDQWGWSLGVNSDCVERETIHEISNKAAEHFLGLLCGPELERIAQEEL